MSKFVLDCDVVQVVGDNVVTYASDMDGAANSVASVSVDCPDVDLESPKQAIITNIKAASIKMKNTSNVINITLFWIANFVNHVLNVSNTLIPYKLLHGVNPNINKIKIIR